MRSTPGQAVWIQALDGDIALLCVVARTLNSHNVLLSSQEYKWGIGELNAGGNPAMD